MASIPPLVPRTDLDGLALLHRGKVRDVYDLGDRLLLVATDRVSAFDCVLAPAIPYKGAVLTALSAWWFAALGEAGLHTHFLTADLREMPAEVRRHEERIVGRATLCRKLEVVPVECVVRGYLAGSAVQAYRETGALFGVRLPAGLRAGDELPSPCFTPTTKAAVGHDQPLAPAELEASVGAALAQQLTEIAVRVYRLGRERAAARGLLLVDTKVEIGRDPDGVLAVCDEVLTPDSSRYWEAAAWGPGLVPEPLDKQVVRNHLLAQPWDRTPPAPSLPPAVVVETARRYLRLYRMLTGAGLLESA